MADKTADIIDPDDGKETYHRKERFKFDSTRFVSAEIEVASSEKKKARELLESLKAMHCAVVHDGSVGSAGYEINTSPAYGDTYVKEIINICDALKYAGAKISPACGLHVHIDCRDFKLLPDLNNLLKIYVKVEAALWGLLPQSRQTNRYCRPCGGILSPAILKKNAGSKGYTVNDLAKFKKSLALAWYGSEEAADEYKTQKRHEGRYNALNVHSFFFRYTMEFRHHQGSLNFEKIINWTIICCKIVDFAKNVPEEELNNLLKNDSPWILLVKIVGDNPNLIKWMETRTAHFKNTPEDDNNVYDDVYYEKVK